MSNKIFIYSSYFFCVVKIMKYTIILSLIVFSLNVNAQKEVIKWSGLQKYSVANDSIGKADVVFMGNSITENWVKFHPEFFEDNHYTGRGISGHTSYQFLLRFREDVIKLNPRIVIINAGTNDIAENCGQYVEEYTFGNIISMVELAQSNGIKVIMSSVLPASAFKWRPSVKDAVIKIKSLNKRLKEYAEKNDVPYIDYYEKMVNSADGSMIVDYTRDGVHPNLKGYFVMEELAKPLIKRILINK